MFGRKTGPETEPISGKHSILTDSTTIKGAISTENNLRIDGNIDGDVICKGKMIIGTTGCVIGDIKCSNIEILGKVTGNIICSDLFILRTSGSLTGDIKTKNIEVETGAQLDGRCSVITDAEAQDIL